LCGGMMRLRAPARRAAMASYYRSSLLGVAAALLMAAFVSPPAYGQARPNYVNLAAYQTPIKSQGRRSTCIVFASIAALEAAYSHAGYGQLDLSEQFLNHMGKMLWLKPETVDQR